MRSIRPALLILTAALLSPGEAPGQGPNRGAVPPDPGPPPDPPSDVVMVERLIAARRDYRESLEALYWHYTAVKDVKRAEWAREELHAFHRTLKQSFRLDVKDLPPPDLKPTHETKEANQLLRQALTYKDKGFGDEYVLNQRRAELLLQTILDKHPVCKQIGYVAYELGDLYESKAYQQYERAAAYFERSYQWGGGTPHDARMRAARIYDKNLKNSAKAAAIYRQVIDLDTDTARVAEARARIAELGGG